MGGKSRPFGQRNSDRFASLTQRELDNATLNQLAQSGSHIRLYSAQDAARTTEKLARHTAFSVVSEQLKARSGETDLDAAIALQKAGLHTPAEQVIHLSIPLLESEELTFTRPQLLATALETGGGKVPMTEIDATIQAQIKAGSLLNVPVAPGHGNDLLISRQTWDAEKSILTKVLEGKEAVAPLMDSVPGSLMTDLTSGQRASTRMILETTDRFTVVQGYAGVGKTTQLRAVTGAISLLPEATRPRVIGLGPTHRAVGKCRAPAWMRRLPPRSCMTRSSCSVMVRHRISATRCSCSTRAQWWGWPIPRRRSP